MAGGRKVLIWAIVGVFVLAIIATGLIFFRIFNQQAIPLMQAVPTETLVLIRPQRLKDLPTSLEGREALFRDLSKIPLTEAAARDMILIDSLLGLDPKCREMVRQNEVLVALLPSSAGTADMLLLCQIRGLLEARTLNKFIKDHHSVTREESEGRKRKINRVQGNRPYYYCITRGIFIGSHSLATVNLALEQMDAGSFAFTGKGVQELMLASGKNVDANVFFNTDQLIELIAGDETAGSFRTAALAGDFASLDLVVKDDGLLLNGFFSESSVNKGFGSIFNDQEVVTSVCPPVLPAATTEYFKLAFSNFDSLCCSLARLKKNPGISEEVSPVSDFEKRHFMAWTGNEVTIARAGPGRQITTFKIRPGADAMNELEGITVEVKPLDFMGTRIFQVSREGMISDLLWPFTGEVIMPYYCQLNGYIVFGSSIQFLSQVIRNVSAGKTLINTNTYKTDLKHITESSHLSYYINLERSLRDKTNRTAPYPADQAGTNPEEYGHFPSFAIQFSLSDKWLYSSMFISHQDSLSAHGTFIWRTALDGELSSGPYLVSPDAGKSSYILADDRQNNVYILSVTGKILAKKQVSGQLLDGITCMEHEGAPATILFNTTNHIYLIDTAGKDVNPFPLQLEIEATTGLTLVPAGNASGSFMVIPSADGKIYAYGLDGLSYQGWQPPSMPAVSAAAPQLIHNKNKNYLIFRDRESNILITDTKGNTLNLIRGAASDPARSGIFINRTNTKGAFLTTNNKGHLVYLPEQGIIQQTSFGDFSAKHFFLYEDIDGNGAEDFIWADSTRLTVFDRLKKEILAAELPEPAGSKPLVVSVSGTRKAILVRGTSGTIYLVDSDGNVFFDEEITSSGQPSILHDMNLNISYIIGSHHNTVSLYPLP